MTRDKGNAMGGAQYVVALLGLGVALAAGAVAGVEAFGAGSVSPAAFWAAAAGASVFYGFGCLAVWRQTEPKDETAPLWPWRVHKWWFNGAGSFAGWCALYYLPAEFEKHGPGVGSFALGLVALLGVCGWLPVTAVGLSQAVGKLADKAVETITPK